VSTFEKKEGMVTSKREDTGVLSGLSSKGGEEEDKKDAHTLFARRKKKREQ